MRRTLIPILLLVVACGSDGETVTTLGQSPVSSTTLPAASPTSTQTVPPSAPTSTTEPLAPLVGLTYSVVAEDLDFPMLITPWTDELSLVGFRDGRIHSFDGTRISDDPLVDLEVSTDGERGLLGFDADGPMTVFVHYSDPAGDTVVSRLDLDSGQEIILLSVDQPASNHNGGMLQIGSDGSLYLGLGDGGGSNDRFGHGQNTQTLLGGIVRIDRETGASELWSYGLRNPYRFWIDGDFLYIGDVGQNAYEEINVVSVTGGGYNFGWPITEALHCFSPQSGCETEGITLPVVEVAHGDAGTCSITGGVVYRAKAIPEVDGHFFYSDYCGGWLRSFAFDGATASDQQDWTDGVGAAGRVVSFGVDHAGEMYVLTPDSIRRIDPVR